MRFGKYKTALLSVLVLLGSLHGAWATTKILADNQSAQVAQWGWYATRGTGKILNGGYSVTGVNDWAHTDITEYFTPGGKYELTGQGVASAANLGVVGVEVDDINWNILQDTTTPLTTSTTNFAVDFTLPANAAYVRLHLTGNKTTSVKLSATNMILKKLPAVVATAPVVTAPNPNKLLYAPPVLVNPTTITLDTGFTQTVLDPTKDYIIKMPNEKKVGTTWIQGGHNIVLIGGYVTIPTSSDLSNNADSRGIYIKNNNGTVHIEGLLIDASGGAMSDGIDISSPNSIVQIENVRVDGVYGFNDEFHADVIQPFGGVKDLRVDKLTGYTAYQGLTLGQDLGPIGTAEFSRVNLVSTGTQTYGAHNDGGFLVWLTPVQNCAAAYPVTFNNVFVQPRAVKNLGQAVWPSTTDPSCPSKLSADGQTVSFTGLPVTGTVHNGLPPGGDYVPVGVAGINYVSPGYQ